MSKVQIESEMEDDGRWLAENLHLPGVMCYGTTREAAIRNVIELSRQVVADRLECEFGPSQEFGRDDMA